MCSCACLCVCACVCLSRPVSALLSHVSGSGGSEGGAQRPAEPIGSQHVPLPANRREAPVDIRGDRRRPVLPQHGEDSERADWSKSGLPVFVVLTSCFACRFSACCRTSHRPVKRSRSRRSWQRRCSCCCRAFRLRAARRTSPPPC